MDANAKRRYAGFLEGAVCNADSLDHRRTVKMAHTVSPILPILPILLRATGISKSYAGVHALRGISFELRAGEVHALIGENGAGKTTLIKIITGAVTPDSGQIEMSGEVVANNSPVAPRRWGFGHLSGALVVPRVDGGGEHRVGTGTGKALVQ